MKPKQLEDLKELARRVMARRAVACKHWRWMPGMVTTTGIRILRRDDDGYTTGYGPRTSYCVMQVFPDALLDLSDPATLGCLLACVPAQGIGAGCNRLLRRLFHAAFCMQLQPAHSEGSSTP